MQTNGWRRIQLGYVGEEEEVSTNKGQLWERGLRNPRFWTVRRRGRGWRLGCRGRQGSSRGPGARPGVWVLIIDGPDRMKLKPTGGPDDHPLPCPAQPHTLTEALRSPHPSPAIPLGIAPALRQRSAGRKAAASARERNCGTAPQRWRPGLCPGAGGSESLESPPP